MDENELKVDLIEKAVSEGYDLFGMSSKKHPKKVIDHRWREGSVLEIDYDDGSSASKRIIAGKFDAVREFLSEEFLKWLFGKNAWKAELKKIQRDRKPLEKILNHPSWLA